MKTLKYTLIKDKKQYSDYCSVLESLIEKEDENLLP